MILADAVSHSVKENSRNEMSQLGGGRSSSWKWQCPHAERKHTTIKQIIRFEIILDCVWQHQESQRCVVYKHSLQMLDGIGPVGSFPFSCHVWIMGQQMTQIHGNTEFLFDFLLFPYVAWESGLVFAWFPMETRLVTILFLSVCLFH